MSSIDIPDKFTDKALAWSKIYQTVYPDADNLNSKLFEVYDYTSKWFKSLNHGGSAYQAYSDEFVRSYLCVWLLYNFPVNNFNEKFIHFVIKTNKKKLSPTDCAMLFYISLQDDETKKALEGFSMLTLHNILDPVAESNFNVWKTAL
jgi:hypothetical protein